MFKQAHYTFKSAGFKDWFQQTSPLHSAYNRYAEPIFSRAGKLPVVGPLALHASKIPENLMFADRKLSERLNLYKPLQQASHLTVSELGDHEIPAHILEVMRQRYGG